MWTYWVFQAFTCLSCFVICGKCIETSIHLFIAAGLSGKDYGRPRANPLPEAVGVVAAAIYLSSLAINLVSQYLLPEVPPTISMENLPAILAGSWSICCMCLLGFTDDVLNLRWRTKLFLPTIASFPLILVYLIQGGSTYILIPYPFRFFLGTSINLGPIFYLYMLAMGVFCTNSINILAGINGLEVGQSLIVGCFLLFISLIEILAENSKAYIILFFIAPYVAVSLSMLQYNWFPARIFVGDTFCYFTGMTFAVCGILGNCSKTLLFLLTPQILNFLYSLPQLFKLFPCPRHRLPKFNEETGLREPSTYTIRVTTLDLVSCVMLGLLAKFRIARITRKGPGNDDSAEIDNMTILNLMLRIYGPLHEKDLCKKVLKLQIYCCLGTLIVKYTLGLILF